MGGKARARQLPSEELSFQARVAVAARWAKFDKNLTRGERKAAEERRAKQRAAKTDSMRAAAALRARNKRRNPAKLEGQTT